MTHLSMQNMNGVGSLMRRRISPNRPATLSSFGEANDLMPDDLGLDPKGLRPNYGTDWIQPPLGPDEVTTQRGTPTPGQLRKARSADRPAYPLTPSNDARDLTNSFTGRPMISTPRRDFTIQYPHKWIPYEDLRAATGPERGPTVPGWGTTPTEAQLRARAENGGQPVPWVAEDHMAHDISGFSSLHEVHGMGHLSLIIGRRVRAKIAKCLSGMGDIPGMVTSWDQLFASPTGTAAVNAVTQQATTAAAAGASPSTIEQIIDVGAKAAALALQASGKIQAPPPPQPAQSSMIPQFLRSGSNTTLYVVGGLALAGAVTVAVMAGRKKGGRRR